MRFRKRLWSDLVGCKNRLKSELKFQGITIPSKFDNPNWSRNFLNWIEEQAEKDDLLKDTLLLMLEEVKLLRMLLLKTQKKLRELMGSEDFKHKSEVLRSIPGIGPLVAMLFLLEVGDIRRFKTFDSLNHFVGLCPNSHSSGDSEKHTGISQRGGIMS
jgi:transposase